MTENEAINHINLMCHCCVCWYGEKCHEDGYCFETMQIAINALEEIQQYRAIGTVEEFKALKEKNTKKRFNIFESHGMRQFVCGCCDRPILTTDNYCGFCGQKLDWK